ncbi:MAG: peptidoglycan DD-metalloendopeptidase family protein [Pseudomonadota bacterium]
MRRIALVLFGPLLCLALAGCGNTRYPAPVRESSPKYRAAVERKPLPPVPPGHYRVQPGDTLFKIAFDKGLDHQALAEWNGLDDPDHIVVGSVLRLTPPRPTLVTRPLAAHANVEARPMPAEPTVSPSPEDAVPDVWSWPARGTLAARFGEGLSKGIDILGMRGQQVQAAAPGKVAYTGAGLRGYGKLIIIRHGKTLLSAYAHNARILVREGQAVARGQVIGEMGDTDADRVKLHFEIRELGKPVDPLNYLPNLEKTAG